MTGRPSLPPGRGPAPRPLFSAICQSASFVGWVDILFHLLCSSRAFYRIFLLDALDALGFVVDLSLDFGLVQPVDDEVLALCDVCCSSGSESPTHWTC